MQLALSHPAPPPLPPPPFEPQHPAETSPLARFALFASVPAPLLAQLAADITCQQHRGGEHLWYAGDQARHVTLIE
ncbi:MAG: hypothetical protein WBG17_13605, partial [Burkholderiaceae bacterium]